MFVDMHLNGRSVKLLGRNEAPDVRQMQWPEVMTEWTWPKLSPILVTIVFFVCVSRLGGIGVKALDKQK